MTNRSVLYLLSILCLVFGAQSAFAASPAMQEMAGILVDLSHHPSAAEKAKLKEIIANQASTENERILATAIANLDHAADDADKAKLKQVINDANAPSEARDMANIILNLNHKPSSADKNKLQMMMK